MPDQPNPACTGVTARWCPAHGTCTCPRGEYEDLNDPGCPLHAPGSPHTEPTPHVVNLNPAAAPFAVPLEPEQCDDGRCVCQTGVAVPAAPDDDPAPDVEVEWCVWWGGTDANDCACTQVYDDQADAEEMLQWIDGAHGKGIATRTVTYSRWHPVTAVWVDEMANARLRRIADRHHDNDDGKCSECGHPWPCDTHRLADGTVPDA